MFVTIKYLKGGKVEKMQQRYADILVKVGKVIYFNEEEPGVEEAIDMAKKPANKALTAKKPKKNGKAKAKKTEYKTRHLTAGDL